MKKKYIIWAMICSLGIGAVFSSCSDYLSVEKFFEDRQNEDKIFKSKDYSEQWLSYCYNHLLGANIEIGTISQIVTNYSDDMIFNETNGNINYRKFKFGEYDYGWTWATYVKCYEGIRQASILINNIDINEELTQTEIADMKAQARFLRGYFYWLLLRKYGPVPIMPGETVSIDATYDEMSYPRSTYDEVVDYIADEMVLAAKDLPEKRNNRNIARATKGAALATRAKALLFTASPINNPHPDDPDKFSDFVDDKGRILMSQTYDEKKWARAAAAAKDVVDLADRGVYKLYTAPYKSRGSEAYPATVKPPYHKLYSEKNFPEGWADIDPFESYRAIFNGDLYAVENPELIFTRGNNGLGDGVNSMANDQMPGSAGGNNCHGLTAKQCDAYALANGEPFDLNKFLSETPVGERFVTEQEVNEGKYPQVRSGVWKEYANREPRFYASVAFNGAFWPFASARDGNYRNLLMWYYRGNTNGRTNASDKWQPTGIGMMKYINPKDCNTNNGKIYDKVDCAIRYADILLMYAEALNELTPGSSFEVATWDGIPYTISRDKEEMSRAISQIRIRGGVPDYEEQVYEDSGELRKYLKRERQIELLGENQRYYDLRRWKDVEKEEAEPVYGCNVLMTQAKAEDFYDRVRVEKLQTSFSRKMYFWPIDYGELKHNKRMTQAPGWKTYD